MDSTHTDPTLAGAAGGGAGGAPDRLPPACTLGPGDGPARLRRWEALAATASPVARLRDHELEVRYEPGPGVAEELRALIAAERVCCPFATWELDDADGRPVLRIAAASGSPDDLRPIAVLFGAV